MPFLFDGYGARVTSAPRPEPIDTSTDIVFIATRNLIFEFSCWRRENYAVRGSPNFAPTDSYELVDALRVADPTAKVQSFPTVESWHRISRLLEPRFSLLEAAFHRDNFQDTKVRLAQFRLSPRVRIQA